MRTKTTSNKPESKVALPEYWVAEWSQQQQAFHVDTLKDSILNGLMNYFHPWGSDWTLLGVFPTHLEAHKCCEVLEAKKPRAKRAAPKKVHEGEWNGQPVRVRGIWFEVASVEGTDFGMEGNDSCRVVLKSKDKIKFVR